jgi:hypothetical protein
MQEQLSVALERKKARPILTLPFWLLFPVVSLSSASACLSTLPSVLFAPIRSGRSPGIDGVPTIANNRDVGMNNGDDRSACAGGKEHVTGTTLDGDDQIILLDGEIVRATAPVNDHRVSPCGGIVCPRVIANAAVHYDRVIVLATVNFHGITGGSAILFYMVCSVATGDRHRVDALPTHLNESFVASTGSANQLVAG